MAYSKTYDAVIVWLTRYSNFLILILIILIILYLWVRVPSGLPPCPRWVLPGYAHSLMVKGDLAALFRRLRKEHGDVFSFWLSGQLVVVINGFEKIREVFVDDGANLAWRPDILNCDLFHYGVLCTSGRQWREQRHITKAALDLLHDKGLEQQIWQGVKDFLVMVEKEEQAPFDPRILVQSAVFISQSNLLFGIQLKYSDQRVCEGVSHFNENIRLYSDARFPNFFPFEKFLIGDVFDTKFLRLNMVDVFRNLINPQCDQHAQLEGGGEGNADFVSVYLQGIQQQQALDKEKKEQEEKEERESGKKKKKGDEKESSINRVNMEATVYDILWHGTTTLGGTLQWALLYLLHHPDVQARAQDEIDANFASDRVPLSASDRSKLPFLEAIVLETLRLGTVLPFAVAHAPLKEMKFHGYRIPTNAVVVPNLDSVLMDPQVFKNPDAFNPERFLDSSGRVSTAAKFIPFMFGNRMCLGDKVARLTLFMFLFGLLQKFELQPEEKGKLPPLTKGYKLISVPKDFKMRFVPRK